MDAQLSRVGEPVAKSETAKVEFEGLARMVWQGDEDSFIDALATIPLVEVAKSSCEWEAALRAELAVRAHLRARLAPDVVLVLLWRKGMVVALPKFAITLEELRV